MSLRASRTAHTERGRLDRRANELDTTIRKRPSRNNSALSRLRDIGLIDLHCARITSCRLFSMPSAMNHVAPRGVSVVCHFFVMSGILVLGGLLVVTGSMLKMF